MDTVLDRPAARQFRVCVHPALFHEPVQEFLPLPLCEVAQAFGKCLFQIGRGLRFFQRTEHGLPRVRCQIRVPVPHGLPLDRHETEDPPQFHLLLEKLTRLFLGARRYVLESATQQTGRDRFRRLGERAEQSVKGFRFWCI